MATRRPSATILFVAVAGEEQGLLGSTHLANQLTSSGNSPRLDIQGMFTDEIVGSSTSATGFKGPFTVCLFAQGVSSNETASQQSTRLSIGGESDSPARELGRFVWEVGE